VFSNVKTHAGLYQVIHAYAESTSALRKLYPNLGAVETLPAWIPPSRWPDFQKHVALRGVMCRI